ncbi:MAG: flagellar biosynthetic protein FliO [Steroidobacteraceae bacterium]
MPGRALHRMLAAALLAWSGAAVAASPDGVDVGRALLSLLMVVALILALGLVLRGRVPGGAAAARGAIEVRAQLPLGPRERLVVVRVGGEELLLGVSPAGLRTLHVLGAPLPEAPAGGDPDGFAARLRSMVRGGGAR